MLEDKFGRRFHYLRLSITDVCNFRCTYCLPDGYQADSSRQFLTPSEAEHIVRAFARLGTSKVRITGGEPSLRKDLPEIIARIKNIQGIETVAITTNGYKLSTQIDDWIDAGLDAMNVSIDSLDANMFHRITGHDKLDEILNGIEKAKALGLKSIKVNSVLMKRYNQYELKQFLNWIKHQSITLRFIELMQTGDNEAFFNANHQSGDEIKTQLLSEGWTRIVRNKAAGPAQEFEHPDYQGRIGLIMPYSNDFCKSCNRLRITALGKLHLCLFSEYGIDLREHIQAGNVELLANKITELLGDKKATHYLHEGLTGATKHLAMLGG